MTTTSRAAAVSHVGKIRANNQDSGYAGTHLFLVADGMGGHAGGDVASAIAVNRIRGADTSYSNAEQAADALTAALKDANAELADTVYEHPELAGMGTTVSGIIRVGDHVALAHIGDSRIYLVRDGALEQISTDHTFVQRLVETGRITPEEAMVHPRRSVLMRVLGDVDAAPEIDSWVLDTRPGDRWLICSDGLSGVVKDDDLRDALTSTDEPRIVADRLIRLSLNAGAPDNVTVVLVDIGDDLPRTEPSVVGSAANPLAFTTEEEEPRARIARMPTLRLHPRPATGPTHFEPQAEDYLDELIEEDRRRARRRRITWLAGVVLLAAALVTAAVLGYQWTQSRYYVGVAPSGNVAVFQGIQQGIGPLSLSHVYDESDVAADTLPTYVRQQVTGTINADSLEDAERIVKRLTDATNR